MSSFRQFAVPACPPLTLRRCPGCAPGRHNTPGLAATPDDARGPARTDRPAWQSPYGPAPHRTHR
ncbi:hypothetical protein, partial [Streptomyces sp. SID3212]|uniref:hypothetical protein n=1 Tax=Streptomyces sp. SID3212 TaxID=2690259 RepID=UPI001F19B363